MNLNYYHLMRDLPITANKQFNLNNFYRFLQHHIKDPKNPAQIQQALSIFKYDKDTYGGYGEDRKEIWAETYLKESGKFIHLGIDINARRATQVFCPFSLCNVVDTFTDIDTKIGWGGRVILERGGLYLVIGHLEPSSLTNKKILTATDTIGEVGTWPTNGNTFEHIHIQVIKHKNFQDFDGYGHLHELIDNPNPFEVEFD